MQKNGTSNDCTNKNSHVLNGLSESSVFGYEIFTGDMTYGAKTKEMGALRW